MGQVLAVEEDLPLRRWEQAQEQAAQGAFAAPGLPHQRQGLPFVDLQVYLGNAVEKGPLFPLHGEVFGETPCLG